MYVINTWISYLFIEVFDGESGWSSSASLTYWDKCYTRVWMNHRFKHRDKGYRRLVWNLHGNEVAWYPTCTRNLNEIGGHRFYRVLIWRGMTHNLHWGALCRWTKNFGPRFSLPCNGHQWIFFIFWACRPTGTVSPSDKSLRISYSDFHTTRRKKKWLIQYELPL